MLNIGAFGKTMAKSACAVNSQSKEKGSGGSRILHGGGKPSRDTSIRFSKFSNKKKSPEIKKFRSV